MAEDASVQLSRLVALATFIAENPGTPLADVASHFGRSSSQLRRDVAVLIDSGFDDLLPGRTLELDLEAYLQEGTLSLRDPLGLERSATLTRDDLALLTYGLQALAPLLSKSESEAIPKVLEKLALLSGVDAGFDRELVETISAPGTAEHLHLLRGAVERGQRVTFQYVSGSGATGLRMVQPTALTFARDGWLLDSLCLTSGAPRTFRLDRMSDVKLLPKDAPVPVAIASSESVQQAETVFVGLSSDAGWLIHESAATAVRPTQGGFSAEFVVWDPKWMRTELLLLSHYVTKTNPSQVLEDAKDYAAKALRAWNEIRPRRSPEND